MSLLYTALMLLGTFAAIGSSITLFHYFKAVSACNRVMSVDDWSYEVVDGRMVYWVNGVEYVTYVRRCGVQGTIDSIRTLCERVPNTPWMQQVARIHVNGESVDGATKLIYPNGMFKATRSQVLRECGKVARGTPVIVAYYDGEIRVMK